MSNENIDAIVKTMDYMSSRWEDEKAYEDPKDYVALIEARLEDAGFEFVSLGRDMTTLKFTDDVNMHFLQVTDEKILVDSYDKEEVDA